ncbi:hypothetical protein [Natrinema longum]|uniref:DUF7978 domain-containing protein n=1 Tax=Natrinema longum TaxID=370324 RepID=A0A8A2UDB8_9EURY|nr:hypothetical protein [Natrinema longum]MBZ6495293.1 hypothetical protein [Natrinema longum]QSW86729.1 hypothetical protein J0X27_07935 [Natrinema longum]
MSPQSAATDRTTVSRGSSIAASAGLGVFAAVIGYLVTYLVVGSEVRGTVSGDDIAGWKAVAWYFYEAHMVDIEATSQVGSFGGRRILSLIADSSAAGVDLLYVLPPLVLVGAGAFLAVRWSVTDLGDAVVAGAPVAIGYAVVLGLGAVVAEANTEASALGIEATGSIGPALLPAIVLGGVLYPLVFATAGAAIVAAVTDR